MRGVPIVSYLMNKEVARPAIQEENSTEFTYAVYF